MIDEAYESFNAALRVAREHGWQDEIDRNLAALDDIAARRQATELDSASEMSYIVFGIVFSIMLVIGAFASVGTFELEFFNGLVHAGLYLLVTLALAVSCGFQLATG